MEWYRHWFGDEYLLVYEHRDRKEAERESEFIIRTLDLRGGERVLDLCCGSGRHVPPLTRLGCRVIGLDYSLPLLRIAREAAAPDAEWPRYVRADARNIPFRNESFDVALNLFTSFGYFDDCANFELLRSISRLLHEGGKYCIDYLNPPFVLSRLTSESERERNGVHIREQREIHRETRRVEKTITLSSTHGERVFHESVRLYTLDEMLGMLGEAGLAIGGVFGSAEGEAYGESSPRMILWGKKSDGVS
jgi:SAM-dependent methyltransferase